MVGTIVQLLGIVYATGIILSAVAAWLARYSTNRTFRPKVSVIIAARNEEHNISRCLESVMRLTYPRELLEVIVVNDRSTDSTPAILHDIMSRFPVLHVVNATPGVGHLVGKTNAITQGIDASSGEILLMTDADCTLPPSWVEEIVKYYTDDTVGLVPGFTAIRHRNLFEAVQAADWFALFSVASAATWMGVPVTAVGTNFTIRRAAYDAVGGYRNIPFSVTEDYALFHAVTSQTSYRARYPMDPGTVVGSEPCPTLRDLFGQRKRWFTGGKGMDLKSILIFASVWLLNLLILVALFTDPGAALAALGMKIAADFVLTLPATIRFRQWSLLPAFPFFELYFFLYVLIFPPIVLTHRDVTWKERSFKGESTG